MTGDESFNIRQFLQDDKRSGMARLARLEIADGWYHVINRGHERRVIYRDRRAVP